MVAREEDSSRATNGRRATRGSWGWRLREDAGETGRKECLCCAGRGNDGMIFRGKKIFGEEQLEGDLRLIGAPYRSSSNLLLSHSDSSHGQIEACTGRSLVIRLFSRPLPAMALERLEAHWDGDRVENWGNGLIERRERLYYAGRSKEGIAVTMAMAMAMATTTTLAIQWKR
nr:hypothetical protein CFP56_04527 [Quercus suber]